jgi:hypothetical protein
MVRISGIFFAEPPALEVAVIGFRCFNPLFPPHPGRFRQRMRKWLILLGLLEIAVQKSEGFVQKSTQNVGLEIKKRRRNSGA